MALTSAALLLTLLTPQELSVPFQKFVLDNGLEVVIHEDHANPVVAVYVSYHVGSAREEPGRSGFAHLFEHMLFQGSQHVGDDQHFKLISEAGGTLNGTTNLDRTLYFETLPSNQLELALWLESDRMAFLLPAMTQEKLDNQREVVKNERRQNYENRPYGQGAGLLAAELFPADHPYSWLTIGSHEDLTAASLEDVRSFFRRWYGPNNATLAIGGDVDTAQALALVEKYFGSIPRGPAVEPMAPRAAVLAQAKRAVLEDEVQLPRLDLVWSTVEQGHADEVALDLLAGILAGSKSSPLTRSLTIDRTLARNVNARNQADELAGRFSISVTAMGETSLDQLELEVQGLLAAVARDGVDANALQREKNSFESSFVQRLETVSGRTGQLATNNMFFGDATHFLGEPARRQAVTPQQVAAVLQRYLIGKPAVVLSIVPKGRTDLAASGRSSAQLARETQFDRTTRPAAGPRPTFRTPAIWHEELAGGLKVLGTRTEGLPLTTLQLSLPGGRAAESATQLGLASLTAGLMDEGTRELSSTELADALDFLGARLSIGSDDDELSLSLSVLDKHLEAALELFADVLLEPRLAAPDFERLKKRRLTEIATRGDNIRGITGRAWSRLMYGPDSVEGRPGLGTEQTVGGLKVEDARTFHARVANLAGAELSVASGHDAGRLSELLAPLLERWRKAPTSGAAPVAAAAPSPAAAAPAGARLFLIDKPGAAQSEVRIGELSVDSRHPDFYGLSVLNYVLGGAFSSRINMNLREDKGYTYGARSGFSGGVRPGTFTASAGVHTQVTAPSVREFMKELEGILDGVTQAELDFARSALTQAAARRYESSRARLSLLDDVRRFGWPDDYPERELAELERLTPDDLRALAREHLHPERMTVLVVGDAAEIAESLGELGLGGPVLLDIDGAPLPAGAGN